MGVNKATVTRGDLERRIDQAMGRMKADLVIKNTRFLNVVTGEIAEGDVQVITQPCGKADVPAVPEVGDIGCHVRQQSA